MTKSYTCNYIVYIYLLFITKLYSFETELLNLNEMLM